MKDHKLCYISGNWAFFTNADDQWGDDWNDAPASCNAGEPYEDKPGQVIRVGFTGSSWSSAADVHSVEAINNSKWIPWVEFFHTSEKIMAGCTLSEFKDAVRRNGGKIFVEEVNA